MKLARVIRLDGSDLNVFPVAADPGEWAISGAFEFADWTEAQLQGKPRQAFSNGWLGLGSFGRASFAAVCPITRLELDALADTLAQHFIDRYGAPDRAAADPVAAREIAQMREMCEDQDDNTLLTVARTLEQVGVRERFRVIAPQQASLASFAVHGS